MEKMLFKLGTLLGLPAALLLSGCVDNNYDLSDIDTTSRFSAVDLILPVNIEPVSLGAIIKTDENNNIKNVDINGEEFYAFVDNGDFRCDSLSIAGVKATPSPINPTRDPLSQIVAGESAKRRAPEAQFVFGIKEIGNTFSYNALNIDKSIVSIDDLKTNPFKFTLALEIEDNNGSIGAMTFENLMIRAPKGLTTTPSVGTYDAESGYWNIPKIDVQGNKSSVWLDVTGIDAKLAGIKILEDRSLDFKSQFIIESGEVSIQPKSANFEQDAVLAIEYILSEFDVTAFSGQIHYDLDGLNIDPIALSNMPRFLRGENTRIEIANPQIYLQLNNPVAAIPLRVSTGLTISAHRNGQPTLDFPLPSKITLEGGGSTTAMRNFVLSPSEENLYIPEQYASNIDKIKYEALSSILSTPESWSEHSIPNRLDITLEEPSVPTQPVKDFTIPHKFVGVTGNYEIFAPLTLNDGSFIYYTDVRDGWNDEDVDAIVITALTITAHAVNNIPAEVQITIYPLDVDGNVIEGAEIVSNTVPANAESEVEITLKGEVRHLDGIRIEAFAEADGSGETLSKTQTLDMTDIRAKVSGYYDKKF